MSLTPADMHRRPIYDLQRRMKGADVDLHTIQLAAAELSTRHTRMLAEYVDNPEDFLGILEQRGACIAGSFVSAYIHGSSFPAPQDLDVFCNSTNRAVFLDYFLHIGYHLIPTDTSAEGDKR